MSAVPVTCNKKPAQEGVAPNRSLCTEVSKCLQEGLRKLCCAPFMWATCFSVNKVHPVPPSVKCVEAVLVESLDGIPNSRVFVASILQENNTSKLDQASSTHDVFTAHPSDGKSLFRDTFKMMKNGLGNNTEAQNEEIQYAINQDLKRIEESEKPTVEEEWDWIKQTMKTCSNEKISAWIDCDRSDKQERCYTRKEQRSNHEAPYINQCIGYIDDINQEREEKGQSPIKAQLRLSAEHINDNLYALENSQIDTFIIANFTNTTILQNAGVKAMRYLMNQKFPKDNLEECKNLAAELGFGENIISVDDFIDEAIVLLEKQSGHDLLFTMNQILDQDVYALLEDPEDIAGAFSWSVSKKEEFKSKGREGEFATLRHKMMHACSDMGGAGFAGTLMSFVMSQIDLLDFKGTGNSALRHPSLPIAKMATKQGSNRHKDTYLRDLNDDEIAAYWSYLGEVYLDRKGPITIQGLSHNDIRQIMEALTNQAKNHYEAHQKHLKDAGDISKLKKLLPSYGSRPVQTEKNSGEIQGINQQRAISRVALAHFKGLWPAWMMPNAKWSKDKQEQEFLSFKCLMSTVSSETLAGVAERLCAIPEHFIDILKNDTSNAESKTVVDLYNRTQKHREFINAVIQEKDIEIITPSKRPSTEFLFLANAFINRPPSAKDSFFNDLLENANTENKEFFNELKVMSSKKDQDTRLKLAFAVNLGSSAAGLGSI